MIKIKSVPVLKKFILMLLIFYCCAGCSQEKGELTLYIENEINKLENFIDSNTIRLEISTEQLADFDDSVSYNFEKPLNFKVADSSAFQNYFNSLKTSIDYYVPYTLVRMEENTSKLAELMALDALYYGRYPLKVPSMSPIKVIYKKGEKKIITDTDYTTRKTINKKYGNIEYPTLIPSVDLVYDKSIHHYTVALHSYKPIQEITCVYEINYFDSKISYLQKPKDKISIPKGEIEIIDIGKNEVIVKYPTEISESIQIAGLYKDGRFLREKSSNSHTILSNRKTKEFNALYKVLKKSEKLIRDKKIKTKIELKNYLEKNTPNFKEEIDIQYTQKVIRYNGPLDKIIVRVNLGEKIIKRFTSTYKFNNREKLNYQIAEDLKTKKSGLINNKGEWIIKPRTSYEFKMVNRFYFSEKINYNDEPQFYRFIPKTNTLIKVPYFINREPSQYSNETVYSDKYVIISDKNESMDAKKGIVDITSGKIVLPIVYKNIWYMKGNQWEAEMFNGKSDKITLD